MRCEKSLPLNSRNVFVPTALAGWGRRGKCQHTCTSACARANFCYLPTEEGQSGRVQSRKLVANHFRRHFAQSVAAVGAVLQMEVAIWLRNDVTGDTSTGLLHIARFAGDIIRQPAGCLLHRVPKSMHVNQKSNFGFSITTWCFQSATVAAKMYSAFPGCFY